MVTPRGMISLPPVKTLPGFPVNGRFILGLKLVDKFPDRLPLLLHAPFPAGVMAGWGVGAGHWLVPVCLAARGYPGTVILPDLATVTATDSMISEASTLVYGSGMAVTPHGCHRVFSGFLPFCFYHHLPPDDLLRAEPLDGCTEPLLRPLPTGWGMGFDVDACHHD